MNHLSAFAGTPDFSAAAKAFYQLPMDLREGLNRSEEKCLIWTLFLSWFTAARGGKGAWYATFSEEWVGMKFGRSRWTAQRALARLKELGLLEITRRAPRPGMLYQTNLYRLGQKLLAVFAKKTAQPREKIPCSKSASQQFGKKSIRLAASPSKAAASQGKEEPLPPNTPKDPKAETFEEFHARIRRNYTARAHPVG